MARKIINISIQKREFILREEFNLQYYVYREKYKKWKKIKEENMNKGFSSVSGRSFISPNSSPSSKSLTSSIYDRNIRPSFIFLPPRSKMEQLILKCAKENK